MLIGDSSAAAKTSGTAPKASVHPVIGRTATSPSGGAAPAGHASPFHFGDSAQHRPLVAIASGPRDALHTVVVVGCIHGNETAGVPIVRALRRRPALRHVRIWTIECVNPDGRVAGTRQNARQVDLNRNFPYRWRAEGAPGDVYYPGRRAASEPETRAVVQLVRALRPDLTIWYHQHLDLVDRPGGRRRNALAAQYARASGLRLRTLQRYHGSVTSWENHTLPAGTAFVVELAAGRLSARDVERHVAAVRLLARVLQRQP